MTDRAEATPMDSCQIVERFVNWLYDESLIWPDEVPRERLIALWAATHQVPSRTETAETRETRRKGRSREQSLHHSTRRASLGPQRH